MKTRQLLTFALPIGIMAAGLAIGGKDGALLSLLGAAALFIFSFWQAIKIVSQQNQKPVRPPRPNTVSPPNHPQPEKTEQP